MEVTFLGHQGWCFVNNNQAVLLDPIFEFMGNGDTRLPVWPPRRLNFDSMPPISAIIVSHEHSDHFSIDTLLRIPFRGDIWIPNLSSYALEEALRDMGFSVNRMASMEDFHIADMKFTPLPMKLNNLEIDVYSILVRSNNGASFFTLIDAVPSDEMYEYLDEFCSERTLDNFTNNYIESPKHDS